MPIITFQHVACNQPTPCSVAYEADSISQSEPEALLTTHMIPLSEGSWNGQAIQEISNVSQQEASALYSQTACHVLPSVETGTCNKNGPRSIDSPTSIAMLCDGPSILRETAKRLQERHDLTHQKESADLLSITSFEFNQEQGAWEEVTQKVKSRASIDTYLAEQGQQGHYSSKIEVIEFHSTSTPSKEAGKKYVIKYPRPPKDLTREEAGECDILPLAGEIWAYELSEALKLSLVPETQLVIIQDKREGLNHTSFATMRPYIGDLKRREQLSDDAALQKKQGLLPEDIKQQEYEELVKHDTDDKGVQTLKLFSFIVGQWDQRQGNVLIRNAGSPLAVDNEHIFAPYFAVVKAESYEELSKKKAFIRLGRSIHVRHLGSQDEPMILHGSAHRIKLAIRAFLHDDVSGCEEYELSDEEKELLEGCGKELAARFEPTANSHETASADLSRLKLAYLEEVQRRGEIVSWRTWRKKIRDNVQFVEGAQTIIFYVGNHQIYRHYPTEMLLYMTKCDLDVLSKFSHKSFLKSVRYAGQNTVNKIMLLCDWMEKSGLEFYRGFLLSGYDERSAGYIPDGAKDYPARFVCEVANIAGHLIGETTKRRDSAVRYLIKNNSEETESLISKLHTLMQIDQEIPLDCLVASVPRPQER